MKALKMACKLCSVVTGDARYVRAIDGWKCKSCEDTELTDTGKFDVDALRRQATPVDFNPVMDDAFVVTTREILGESLQPSEARRNHRRHLESLS